MLAIIIIFAVCALVTGSFIILELNWSVKNFLELWNKFPGPAKILAILAAPLCAMPVGIDVGITIGINMLLGAEGGMVGLMVSMLICSMIAGYLYYMRRKHHWRYF